MTRVFVSGVGVLGPGLISWPLARDVLSGRHPYEREELALPAPEILSGRERRRSSATVRLALNVAHEAIQQAGIAPSDVATVFGSSNGSGLEIHQILTALRHAEMLVSPTLFHNSVHNSAVGYWCIAIGNHQPSTSIACHDFTFAAAMMKACAQASVENRPVLLTVFDCPLPAPLHQKRPLSETMGIALVIEPEHDGRSICKIDLTWSAGESEGQPSKMESPSLERLRLGTPAGRVLPLLSLLAQEKTGELRFSYPESGQLRIAMDLC
ncbi:MAG: beta-ketoacyl synthase chain length factor [Pseudomonadota bacterium]